MQISDLVRERGPMTVAAFMDLALYHPELGYYARADRRSGRAGDFFTSVDVGPLFGALLERQLAEMATILDTPAAFDVVEAGAGNGRLSADILRAARAHDPAFYDSIRLHLTEISAAARAAQLSILGETADRLVWSDSGMPQSFDGVLIANELIDAFPVHQVVRRKEGLREVYVVPHAGKLTLVEGALSTSRLGEYLARLGIDLEPGWRVEINLRAIEWIREAARKLRRGFVILIDYGHEARALYSPAHAGGTLTSCRGHQSAGPELAGMPPWLQSPGEQDITSHVDFTSLRDAAEAGGLQTLGFMDQTYFLLGLLPPEFGLLQSTPNARVPIRNPQSAIRNGKSAIRNEESALRNLKTLIMPGGLGSTHKVMIFGQDVGTPALQGCSYRMRVT